MVKTNKRNNYKNNKSKQSKKFTGGGLGLANLMQKGINKATGEKEKCNLALDYYSKFEAKLYSKSKLLNKLEKLEFIKLEPELFKKIFKSNLENFCVTIESKRNLKFCSNLLNCLKDSTKFYEVLYDVFNVDEKQPLTKQLYNAKKKLTRELSMVKFIEDEKKLRVETMARFLIDVLFQSIIKYEKKHPPEKKIPQNALVFKKNLEKLFKNLDMDFDLKKITKDEFLKLLKEKEVTIMDYYTSRVSKGNAAISTIENKDKRTPTFLKLIAGVVISVIIVETGWFDAPPGVPGGIS
jgi:hypothetical protein